MDEHVIEHFRKLQETEKKLGQAAKLNLPRVVVIGGQSTGKSSLLESLVGRSFLPRGKGIVTRRPLIINLVHTERNQFVAQFSHLNKEQVFTDGNSIRDEITAETERAAGDKKNVVDSPIILTIYAHNVLTVTLVDLPGIARVPQEGQPEDIEQQTEDMSMAYIEDKSNVVSNALILAVTAADQDLANSDGKTYDERLVLQFVL